MSTLSAATRSAVPLLKRDRAHADDLPFYDSAQRLPPALEELVGLVRFRDLVVQLVRCDVVSRYKRSYLGVVWTMLNPLGTTLVLVAALGAAFGTTRLDYALHALTGLMVWNFVSVGTVNAIQRSLTGSRNLPGLYLPRTLHATVAVGTALVNLILATVPVLLVVLCAGVLPGSGLALLPLVFVLLGLFGLGVSLLVASLSIRFADVAQTYSMALPAWMYLTPIIYPVSVLSQSTRAWLPLVNPLWPLVQLYRASFTAAAWPGAAMVGTAVVSSLLTLALGWIAFTSRVDELGRIA